MDVDIRPAWTRPSPYWIIGLVVGLFSLAIGIDSVRTGGWLGAVFLVAPVVIVRGWRIRAWTRDGMLNVRGLWRTVRIPRTDIAGFEVERVRGQGIRLRKPARERVVVRTVGGRRVRIDATDYAFVRPGPTPGNAAVVATNAATELDAWLRGGTN